MHRISMEALTDQLLEMLQQSEPKQAFSELATLFAIRSISRAFPESDVLLLSSGERDSRFSSCVRDGDREVDFPVRAMVLAYSCQDNQQDLLTELIKVLDLAPDWIRIEHEQKGGERTVWWISTQLWHEKYGTRVAFGLTEIWR